MSMRQSMANPLSCIERVDSMYTSTALPAACSTTVSPLAQHVPALIGNNCNSGGIRFVAFLSPSGDPLPSWLHFNPKRCSFFGIPYASDRGQWLLEIQAYRLVVAEEGGGEQAVPILVKTALLLLEVV